MVGLAVFPDTILAAADLLDTDGLVVSTAGARALSEDIATGGGMFVRFKEGVNRSVAAQRLEAKVGNEVKFRLAPEVRNLNRARWTPTALAAVLAALGLATLTHFLVTAGRRRRVDLAILQTFGLTQRSVSATVSWQAVTLVGLSLLTGIPVGLVAGRLVWSVVATNLEVLADPALPIAVTSAAASATLVLGTAIAVFAQRSQRQRSVAEVLRTE